ncbi:MAG: FAD binding domain-containing protein [Phycisphaerae bacterium]
MYLPDVTLHEAHTLADAAALTVQYAPDVRVLAGGTDVLVDLKTGRVRAQHLVSIRRIDSLHGVEMDNGVLRIGALTTITQLIRSPLVVERFAAMLDAASRMAAAQVRSMATVGGNLASAVPCADLPPILMVMNASVRLWSPNGERDVPVDAFFVGPRRTVCRDDEILTSVLVPTPPPGFGAAYARFALRDGNAIAVASVAAGLVVDAAGQRSDGRNPLGALPVIREARIALGAVSPIPKLVEAAGTRLVGTRLDEDVVEEAARLAREAADPICDVRGSAEFRREVVEVLTQRALATAMRRATEASE